jgi:glycerophosphoryl diester phosphodiesterase
MLIYGHRGASSEQPENTLRAFARAIELGAHGIELDVQSTADRVPVIMHDRDVSRTTSGTGAIDRLSLAEIRGFDAGKGEPVPTFDEVLDLIGSRVHLDIEIKQGGIEREVLGSLARHPEVRWAISSFDWTSLERVRTLASDAELWLLADDMSHALVDTAKRLGATAVALNEQSYTAESAKQLRSSGLDAVIWTVNDVERAKVVRDLGARGMCTDDPATMIAAFGAATNG